MLDLIDRFGWRSPIGCECSLITIRSTYEIGNSRILVVGKTGKSTYAMAGLLRQQSHRYHAEQCIAWQRWRSACHGARRSIGKAPISAEAMAMHVHAKRAVARPATTLEPAVSLFGSLIPPSIQRKARDRGNWPGARLDLFPAPPSVGAFVPLTYFGPSPSTVNPSLVGPVQLLNTGTVDAQHGTITIPLYKGRLAGTDKTNWYILTDVDNEGVAAELGLNFSAKLNFASQAARTGNLDSDGNIVFDKGTVNFAPKRNIVPGPAGAEFPPKSFAPGSVGDANYSPYVRIVNAADVIYNAPMVAFDVDANEINFPNGNGGLFEGARPSRRDRSDQYDGHPESDQRLQLWTSGVDLSMDASVPLAAAIEHNTYAPLMGKLLLGHDDSFGSPIERIFIATNGPESGACNTR